MATVLIRRMDQCNVGLPLHLTSRSHFLFILNPTHTVSEIRSTPSVHLVVEHGLGLWV